MPKKRFVDPNYTSLKVSVVSRRKLKVLAAKNDETMAGMFNLIMEAAVEIDRTNREEPHHAQSPYPCSR